MAAGPHIIVFGNEKGGSGKSTTAVHVAIGLARLGAHVVGIDLDSRQRTFARYMENRLAYAAKSGQTPQAPAVTVLPDTTPAEDRAAFERALADATAQGCDAIVIDCPGRDSTLARLAHAHADTLVTPMNDSFVDFDLLGQVDPDSFKVARPSFYSEFVWQCRKERAARDRQSIDWVVLRNRLSQLEARNQRRVGGAMAELARRIGFRVGPGLSERVIYREMFPKGLTLLDLGDSAETLTMSHVAARQELRDLIEALNLPFIGRITATAA